MPALLIYLVKVNIALLVFCLGYYAVLRHLTFYTLNRAYLVTAVLFSTLYPLINVTAFVNRHQEIARPIQVVIVNWQAPANVLVQSITHHDKWYWLQMIFWAGVIVLTIRFALQLLSLYRLHHESEPAQLRHYQIRVTKGNINPFSFWRSIYVNPANHAPHELDAILEHEQIHVNEWHTLDILLGEIATVFYWFNPGIWLMKKAIRENIEFITDRKILQQGIDSKSYQYSLVNVNFNRQSNAIVNHFNISTIKKRIIMMNAKRSSNVNLSRYIFLIPAVVALLLVFSVSKAELHKAVKNSTHLLTNIKTAVGKINLPFKSTEHKHKPTSVLKAGKVVIQQDTPQKYIHVQSVGKMHYIAADSLKNYRLLNSAHVKGVIAADSLKKYHYSTINTTVKGSGSANNLYYTVKGRKDDTTIRKADGINNSNTIYGGKMAKNGVMIKGKVINSYPIDSPSKNIKGMIVYKAGNGHVMSQEITYSTGGGGKDSSMKNIKGITVYQDGSVGKDGHATSKIRLNGNIAYTVSIDSPMRAMKNFKVDKDGTVTQNGMMIKGKVINSHFIDSSLKAMKGFKVDKDGSVTQNGQKLNKIRLDGITYSMNGNNATESREAGKDGAVLKNGHDADPHFIINNVTIPVNFNNKLIIIDGKEATAKGLKKLSLDRIETINSLPRILSLGNRDTSLAKYGDKGKNGVIIIITKK